MKGFIDMPKWKYKLLIKNTLDRPLKLDSLRIPYGKKEDVSANIPAKSEGICAVYSPAGKPVGLEFYATFSDVHKPNEDPYGSFTVYVDMPYWKHANKGTCTTTGIMKVDGFQKVPDGNHDFENSVIVTTTI